MANAPTTLFHPKFTNLWLLFSALFLLNACAVQTDDGIMAGPALSANTQALDPAPAVDALTLPRTIAVLPLGNETDSELAGAVVRQTLTNHFGGKNYRILHIQEIDRKLGLAGLEADDIEIDDLAAFRAALGVDGLLIGSVTHFEKTFAGVGARVSVGVSLSLYNAADELVWQAENVQRSYAGGVSASPVGLIVNALAAAKHLYGDINLYRAADDLGRTLTNSMPSPQVFSGQALPRIKDVAHSGVGQTLRYGDVVDFALEGDAGQTANISIDGIGLVELREIRDGQYAGQLAIDPTVDIASARVTGQLMNAQGQFSAWVSPYGLMNIDNTPPQAPTSVKIISKDQGVQVTWELPDDKDAISIQLQHGALAPVSVAIEEQSISLTGLMNFEPTRIALLAEDRAGNQSTTRELTVIAAPDGRYSLAEDTPSAIPRMINGVKRLRAQFGPYLLIEPVTIATDGVLLIEPGTELRLAQAGRIEILGEINAMGTQENAILVRQAEGAISQQFLVFNSNLPNRIAGLDVKGIQLPIQVLSGQPTIAHSSFDDNFNAMMVSGSAKPTLNNNRFQGATASSLIISDQAQPRLQGNVFANNAPFHIQNSSSYTLDISRNVFRPSASPSTILGPVTATEETEEGVQ